MQIQSNTTTQLILALAVLFAVSPGCARLSELKNNGKVGPDYQPPNACISEAWLENGPHFIAAQHAIEDDQWWHALGDPALSNLVQRARCGNLTLKQAMLRIQAQSLRRDITVGNLFPQAQAGIADYQRIQFSENGNQIGIPGLGNSFDLFRFGFNASWEIDLWGKLRRQVESADGQLGASVEDMHDVELSLIAGVATKYTQIRVLQEQIRIAREQVLAQTETQRLAQTRVEVGTGNYLDVSQALATVEATKVVIPNLQASLRQANNDLCLLLGIPSVLLFDEHNPAPIPALPTELVIGMPRDLLRRRPDIRNAEREVAAQSALIGVAAADLLPAFTLRGAIDWQAFEFQDLFDAGSLGGAIIPGFQWNILNYGRIQNNISLQETLLMARVEEYRQTVLNANAEVENALVAYSKKIEELETLRKSIEATRRSLELAEIQYGEGDTDLDRVNNLRKELIARLNDEAAANGLAAVYLIQVYRTLGGGWKLAPPSNSYATLATAQSRPAEASIEILTPTQPQQQWSPANVQSGTWQDKPLYATTPRNQFEHRTSLPPQFAAVAAPGPNRLASSGNIPPATLPQWRQTSWPQHHSPNPLLNQTNSFGATMHPEAFAQPPNQTSVTGQTAFRDISKTRSAVGAFMSR